MARHHGRSWRRPVEAMQQLVRVGSTRQLAWRQQQLNNLEALLQELETPLRAALATDLGKPAVEAFFEIVGVQGELKLAKNNSNAGWRRGAWPCQRCSNQAAPGCKTNPWAPC